MKIAIFSATEFGYKCIETLLNLGEKIIGIFTIPREFKISYSLHKPVMNVRYIDFKKIGERYKIPVIEVAEKMSNPAYVEILKNWNPDFILGAGWYYMIPEPIRDVPPLGFAGFHASLLPKYSGGAPIPWAIINGEKQTGITLFYLNEGVDNGDIIAQKCIPISFSDTVYTVIEKTEKVASDILREVIPLIKIKKAPRIPQNNEERTIFPQRSPEDGLINWNNSPLNIYNFIRAQTYPYPGAFTIFNNERLTIWESKIYDWSPHEGVPGQILAIIDKRPLQGILVSAVKGACPLLLTKIQFGGKSFVGEELARQKQIIVGKILGK